NLIIELQKYEITVVKPPNLKGNERLLEKIKSDYNGNYNEIFDIGRFTILCDNSIKLQTVVAVIKKAEKFNLIVSEDKDFFNKQSKTHHRFHNIKLYVSKYDVYIEMQATLKNYTTLEGYTIIENPKLSHLFYEHIRLWKLEEEKEELFKQAKIKILKPSQLSNINEKEDINNISFKLIKFVYDQLCNFKPLKMKGQAIYVILFDFFKKYIIGEGNPACIIDIISLLKKSMNQEIQEDNTILQALETYIPLQANHYPYIDNQIINNTYDCYQHINHLLTEEQENKNEFNSNIKKQVILLQGKSGSGKSLFCRYLEENLWESYHNHFITSIPIYISLPKCYHPLHEQQIISQALQLKHIHKDIIDVIRENISFIFILDGFDEIFDKYNKNNQNQRYFYDRFNLGQWNAKFIVSCRSHVLTDEDIKQVLIGSNQSQNITEMTHLWPFTKQQIYEETLNSYPNLQKMVEEPFLLQLILTILPSLAQQYGAGANVAKAQVYEVFNDHWIDIHIQNIISKLLELRIQISANKIKSTLKQYCLDLGFDMFIQGTQVVIEPEFQSDNNHEIWSKLDPMIGEDEAKSIVDEKIEIKTINQKVQSSIAKTQDIWEKYFNSDSVAKYVLRRIGKNKYQFLHKSCQEYYAAQKIIFDIISWKPNVVDVNNQQFQQQFEMHVQHLFINYKLLNEELGIIQFIAERIHDINPIYVNLKSRLFRIIEASKNNENVSMAAANAITILNSANVNMHCRNWDNIKIPHAILDRAFLEGTNFSNANLDNVRFYQAFLNKTNFTNASMNGIYFGEYAYFKGHSDRVNGIQFSPDETKIVSWSADATIGIWDILSGKQIHLLSGHTNSVTSVQFSPDGSKIGSCSWDDTVRIWDVSSGQQIQLLTGHSEIVKAIQFSPDGSKIASCSEDKTVRIWDVSSGKQLQLLDKHLNMVTALQFSPDGSKVVSCSRDTTIRIWDVLSGKQLQILEGHTLGVNGIQFLSNGLQLLSYSWDRTIRMWDMSSYQQIQIFEGHQHFINGIRLISDEAKILSFSEDKTIRLWDVLSGRQLQILEGHSHGVTTAQFSLDNLKIVSGSADRTIRIWDLSSGKQLQVLEGHSNIVCEVKFFPNVSKILSCSGDGTIRIWDIAVERKIQLTEGHLSSITGVYFSPDGSKVVSCSSDKTIRLWDVRTGRQIRVFEGHDLFVRGVTFSPDGSNVLSYSADQTLRIWSVSSGEQLIVLRGHHEIVNGAEFSSDGSKLHIFDGRPSWMSGARFSPDDSKIAYWSTDKTLRLCDVFSGQQLQLFAGHEEDITDMQFSQDNSTIVTCAKDNTIRFWEMSSGKQILLLKGHSHWVMGVQFTSESNKILSYSWDKTIRLWNVLSGKQLQVFEGHSEFISKAEFTPDCSKVISYSDDRTIRTWDVSSGRQIQIFQGHIGKINAMKLSPDGSKIVSCSEDRTIRLWNTENKVVGVSGPNLTKCIWQAGVQSYGLSMEESIWNDTNGLTSQQKLLIEQRGGKL
ncbi:WD-40 repeat-containing protein, partial [Reticulomyxa filosa]